jgi:sugar/nucleoside kinase (ribokinase family)
MSRARPDWFLPNGDQLRALTAGDELGPAIRDVLALGTGGVAVTLGADGCLVTRPDSGGYVHLLALA